MYKIYDDLFAPKFMMDAHMACLRLPWNFTNRSARTQYPGWCDTADGRGNRMFGCTTYERRSAFHIENSTPNMFLDALEWFFVEQIGNDEISKHSLQLIDWNLQVKGMDGGIHRDLYYKDHPNVTVLFYTHHEWKEEWGGELLIYDDNQQNVIDKISPLPGRMVYLDSNCWHQALAPNVPNIPRMSCAYRLIRIAN